LSVISTSIRSLYKNRSSRKRQADQQIEYLCNDCFLFCCCYLLFDLNSHSFDHNGGTTNDDNGLLLILLNKQAKWVLFVTHLLLPRFSFSLYWTLCHVCVSVILSLLFSYSDYNKMVNCQYYYDGTLF
jgi:hypothetical protein